MDARSLYNGCDSFEWPRRERDLGVDQRHRERVVDAVCAVFDRHLLEGGHEDGNAHQDVAGRVICDWVHGDAPVFFLDTGHLGDDFLERSLQD